MAIRFNDAYQVTEVKYNGQPCDTVKYNGIVVHESAPPIRSSISIYNSLGAYDEPYAIDSSTITTAAGFMNNETSYIKFDLGATKELRYIMMTAYGELYEYQMDFIMVGMMFHIYGSTSPTNKGTLISSPFYSAKGNKKIDSSLSCRYITVEPRYSMPATIFNGAFIYDFQAWVKP